MSEPPAWLELRRGGSPLVLSIPHTGLDLAGLEPRLVSPWLARKDADWWIGELYAFAAELDATILRTTVSRTVIDVNECDPLRDEGIEFYRLLLEAGVSARCRQMMGTMHGTEVVPMVCPEISHDTARDIVGFAHG